MTIQQLRCFAAAAQYLNIRRAAQDLYISQPAVTHHIQTLEKELGVSLFTRSGRSIALTEPGRLFYMDAIDLLERMDLAEQRVRRSASSQGVLHVACESSIQLLHLAEIYKEYRKEMPDVFVSNTEASGIEGRNMLSANHTDIAIIPDTAIRSSRDLAFKVLFEGSYCCVLPEDHALAGRTSISAADLAHETLILLDTAHCPPEMDRIQRTIQLQCPEAHFCFSGSSIYTLPMIEAGIGIAVMPDFVIPRQEHVTVVPFETAEKISCVIAWHKKDASAKVQKFVEIACRICNA